MHGQSRVVGALLTKIGPNIKEHLLNELRDLPFGIIVSVALQGISWQSEQSNMYCSGEGIDFFVRLHFGP